MYLKSVHSKNSCGPLKYLEGTQWFLGQITWNFWHFSGDMLDPQLGSWLLPVHPLCRSNVVESTEVRLESTKTCSTFRHSTSRRSVRIVSMNSPTSDWRCCIVIVDGRRATSLGIRSEIWTGLVRTSVRTVRDGLFMFKTRGFLWFQSLLYCGKNCLKINLFWQNDN